MRPVASSKDSFRNARNLSGELALVMPKDALTLEPPDDYKG